MNKRKIITNMLVILMFYGLFIMWYENKNQELVATSTNTNNYKIYLITMDKLNQFWYILDQGVSDMANLLGIRYIWEAPQTRNVDEQIDIINKAANNGADAILLAASDPLKIYSAVEYAKSLGVKIIYVDSPTYAEGIVTLATDNYNAGVKAGQTMITELESLGLKNGSIGIIGITPGTSTTMDREKGFRSVIEADGRFKLLNTQYSGGDKTIARSIAKAFIADNSDLVGLLGTSEESAIGIGNEIKDSKKEIVGIGFDYTEEIQTLIDQGYLKATLIQNPYTMGYLGMAETIAALKGYSTGPSFINTGITVRTKYSH